MKLALDLSLVCHTISDPQIGDQNNGTVKRKRKGCN
jgi:hypothetical protein